MLRARASEHDRRIAVLSEQSAEHHSALTRVTSLVLELQTENRSSYRALLQAMRDISDRLPERLGPEEPKVMVAEEAFESPEPTKPFGVASGIPVLTPRQK